MTEERDLRVSLAAWSMHRMFQARELDQTGMLRLCGELGIGGFEFVNTFFPSPQYRYLQQLRALADDLDIRLLLIMCDGEGDLAATDRSERLLAARNHRKWVDIAAVLGCHSVRVNVRGNGDDPDGVRERAVESIHALLDYASESNIDVLVENHGGLSSDAAWLLSLVKVVDHPGFGTLPDFGNFPPEVDRYDAVRKMMPFAKGVSAKCYDFGPDGNETRIDFARMVGIVREAGYSGFLGIEYEGREMAERDGIAAAKRLLDRLL